MATKGCLTLLLVTLVAGCGHTQTHKVGLLSIGDLEGKAIPDVSDAKVLTGSDRCYPFFYAYFLSEAVRDALEGTDYDTLVDAEVTNSTGLFVFSNLITVTGTAVNSKTLTGSRSHR